MANRQKVSDLMAGFALIAETHGVTPAQTVIAWTVQQPGITFSLCGSCNARQAVGNAKAGRVHLSETEIADIIKLAQRI